jgi:ribosomal protein S14
MSTHSSPNSLHYSTHWKETDVITGQIFADGDVSSGTITWTDSVTYGDNIPGWRQKLRDGEDATTSLAGTKVTAKLTTGRATARWKTASSYLDVVDGHMLMDMSVPSGDPSSMDYSKADSIALGRFAQRIIAENTAFQGGIFVGELLQTLRMIRSPAKALRGLVDDWRFAAVKLRRGFNFLPVALRRKRVTEALADSWLEVQFGWRPLLSDIDGGCQALAILNTGRSTHTGHVSAKAEVTGNVSETVTTRGYGACQWTDRARVVSRQIVVYRGAMRVAAQSPGAMRAELLGFNPGSWLPTAWELIPYSFLIDYFTNISEIVNGFSTLSTRLAWCNRTVKRSYIKTCEIGDYLPQFSYVTSHSIAPSKYVCEKTSVSRAKYTGTYVPGFVFEIPSLGSMRWLNIAALIAGRNSDRKWVYGD